MPALLRATALFLGLFFLSACLEESQGTPESEFIFPDLLSEQRMECERDGGRWGASPKGGTAHATIEAELITRNLLFFIVVSLAPSSIV